MKPATIGVDAVRQLIRKRIDRYSARIALARKSARTNPRAARRAQAGIAAHVAVRRAYRETLKALDTIPTGIDVSAASRLATEEFTRVKSAVAKIYEVAQHADHDIADAGDWAIVEGEAQAALNVLREARGGR